MKISILQQDLLPVLQSVSRSIGAKNLPVLANVLLQTKEGFLEISATNLEVGIIKRAKADILEDGEVTIPARTLLEIVSSLPTTKIELTSSVDQLKISTNNFNATLNGIPASEFPAIPLASENAIRIEATLLQKALPEITFAAAADEGRPVLTGILTEIKKGTLELVATDGFRLAHKTAKLKGSEERTFKTLIPRRTFEEVGRLINEENKGNDNQMVEIATSENQNQMIFTIGDTQLSSRLIEGNFPTWEKIVPTKFENKTIVDRQDLLKAVKLASVFARNEANIVKIESQGTHLRVSSEAKELGGQETTVEAEIEGNTITIAFNNKFLIDALMAITTEKAQIHFSGNISPAIITPIGEEGVEYVIMPIRIS